MILKKEIKLINKIISNLDLPKINNAIKISNDAKKINVYEIGNKWIDIGHINDFKKAFTEIKNW